MSPVINHIKNSGSRILSTVVKYYDDQSEMSILSQGGKEFAEF